MSGSENESTDSETEEFYNPDELLLEKYKARFSPPVGWTKKYLKEQYLIVKYKLQDAEGKDLDELLKKVKTEDKEIAEKIIENIENIVNVHRKINYRYPNPDRMQRLRQTRFRKIRNGKDKVAIDKKIDAQYVESYPFLYFDGDTIDPDELLRRGNLLADIYGESMVDDEIEELRLKVLRKAETRVIPTLPKPKHPGPQLIIRCDIESFQNANYKINKLVQYTNGKVTGPKIAVQMHESLIYYLGQKLKKIKSQFKHEQQKIKDKIDYELIDYVHKGITGQYVNQFTFERAYDKSGDDNVKTITEMIPTHTRTESGWYVPVVKEQKVKYTEKSLLLQKGIVHSKKQYKYIFPAYDLDSKGGLEWNKYSSKQWKLYVRYMNTICNDEIKHDTSSDSQSTEAATESETELSEGEGIKTADDESTDTENELSKSDTSGDETNEFEGSETEGEDDVPTDVSGDEPDGGEQSPAEDEKSTVILFEEDVEYDRAEEVAKDTGVWRLKLGTETSHYILNNFNEDVYKKAFEVKKGGPYKHIPEIRKRSSKGLPIENANDEVYVMKNLGEELETIEEMPDIDTIIEQSKEALNELEKLKIVHGDIKLDNMLWDKTKSNLSLIDYGQSQMVEKADELGDVLVNGSLNIYPPLGLMKKEKKDFDKWSMVLALLCAGRNDNFKVNSGLYDDDPQREEGDKPASQIMQNLFGITLTTLTDAQNERQNRISADNEVEQKGLFFKHIGKKVPVDEITIDDTTAKYFEKLGITPNKEVNEVRDFCLDLARQWIEAHKNIDDTVADTYYSLTASQVKNIFNILNKKTTPPPRRSSRRRGGGNQSFLDYDSFSDKELEEFEADSDPFSEQELNALLNDSYNSESDSMHYSYDSESDVDK